MGQRRRWINGSWFAFNYVREHTYEIDSWVFMIQLFYYSLVQKLTWIAISIFYVAMNLTLVQSTTEYVVPMI
jgi:cellulose synthase/poly-beta-1,6-N-acetylglucosamine synthase-like glycosyltransferase